MICGWQAGSPEHQLYERRLLADDAVGTFGLGYYYAQVGDLLAQ